MQAQSGGRLELWSTTFSGGWVTYQAGSSGVVRFSALGNLVLHSDANVIVISNDISGGYVSLNGPTGAAVHLEFNDWGTTIPEEIEAKITDCRDQPSLPCADYLPVLCYALAGPAQQPATGGVVPSATVDPNLPLWVWSDQLGRFAERTGPISINLDQPTYIITHGWDGNLATGSCSSIGCAIRHVAPGANLLAWDWAAAANPDGDPSTPDRITPSLIELLSMPQWGWILAAEGGVWLDAYVSGVHAKSQGNTLGKGLSALLGQYGSLWTSLHLIGHSHGGGVMGQAARIMASLGHPAQSVTTLDTPKFACLGGACLVNSLKYLDPASVNNHAAVFYYSPLTLTCWGVGAPVAGDCTNVRLNCGYASGMAHLWIRGEDPEGCLGVGGWYPPAVWDPNTQACGAVYFGDDVHPYSVLDPTAFPAGSFAEDELYHFTRTRAPDDERGTTRDETAGMILRLDEAFDSASTWTGTCAAVVLGADPDDPNNPAVLIQERADASFYRDLTWPTDSLVMTFDYMYLEPRGTESLTVYVGDEIAYYDSADTSIAVGHLTSSGPMYVGSVAGTTARLNFVLRTGGELSGAVLVDNVRVFAVRTPADLNGDGSVTGDDFTVFAACMAGPGVATPPPGATAEQFARADFDGDLDVDLADFAGFQQMFGN